MEQARLRPPVQRRRESNESRLCQKHTPYYLARVIAIVNGQDIDQPVVHEIEQPVIVPTAEPMHGRSDQQMQAQLPAQRAQLL